MSFYIPNRTNGIVVTRTGDGFRTNGINAIMSSGTIAIAPKKLGEAIYGGLRWVSPLSLHKVESRYETVVIDTPIPRSTAKSFRSLVEFCKGKRLIFIATPRDPEAVACAMKLLTVSKYDELRVVKYNPFTKYR